MIEVKSAAELDEIESDLSEIFVTNYDKDLRFLYREKDDEQKQQKTRQTLITAFSHMFRKDAFYCALTEDQVGGVAAVSNNKVRAFDMNIKELKKYLGGGKSKECLKKFNSFNTPLSHYDNDTAYIEFIEILDEFKGQGLEEELLNYIFEQTSYHEYIVEVLDTQTELMQTLKKCKFLEIQRRMVKIDNTNCYSVIFRKLRIGR